MDEEERRRRLRTYGFSAGERLGDPPSTPGDAVGRETEPAFATPDDSPAAVEDEPATGDRPTASALARPSVLTRILDSLGFRFGVAMVTLGFAIGALMVFAWVPAGRLESAAMVVVMLALSPVAATLWVAVGVLGPPAPFRAGLLLGLYGAALMAILQVTAGVGPLGEDASVVLGAALITIIGAPITVGIVGWVVRRVFMPPEARLPFSQQPDLEPRARPWPPVVIALAYVSLPLGVFTTDATAWFFAALFAAVITSAMIVGGLDTQRRYPERRTPVIVVGLVAGIVAGLAMLQAIWAESRWPERRRSSDMLAIGVSVALVVATTYIAHGQPLGGGPAWVVEPAAGVEVNGPQVELARDILEARLSALEIEARLSIEEDGRIRVQVPADADERLVDRVLGSVGLLEFTPVPSGCAPMVIQDAPQPACLDAAEPLFDGTEIAEARIGQDPTTGEIVVSLELKETGARLFDEHAGQVYDSPNPNERLFAIVLDGVVASAPSINAPRFGGAAQISGSFSVDEASALVAALQAGRILPYTVSVSAEA